MSQLRLVSYLVSSKRKLVFERVLRDLSFAILSLFLIAICGNSQAMAQGRFLQANRCHGARVIPSLRVQIRESYFCRKLDSD
jgi:hypothetical protein